MLNSHGYLSGEYYNTLPFMLYLTLMYIVAGILWGVANYKHKDNVVTVHKFITSVLVVSFLDYFFSYLDLDVYNEDG